MFPVMSEAKVILVGDSVGYLCIPKEVFGILAILGQQEPGVPFMNGFVFVLESVGDEFDGDVSFLLVGVFHPISSVFWGCLDKVCTSHDVIEEIWFFLAIYDEIGGNLIAEVDWYCCQVFRVSPDLCNALAGVKARRWRFR